MTIYGMWMLLDPVARLYITASLWITMIAVVWSS